MMSTVQHRYAGRGRHGSRSAWKAKHPNNAFPVRLLETQLRLLPARPLTDATYGKGAADAALAARAIEMMAEGLPVGSHRPVRPVTIRPDGFYESVDHTGDYRPLSEAEFREGLGRLLSVARDGGWHVYGYAYNWERARGEPVAHFGYLTREVVAHRPDAVVWQDGRPAMLRYEALGQPVGGSLGAQLAAERLTQPWEGR